LAVLLQRSNLTESAMWRALNASFRIGGAQQATAVAEFAARADAPLRLRLEGLGMLSNWAKPNSRDRVTGAWRPLAPRDAGIAAVALRPVFAQLLTGPAQVQRLAVQLAGQLELADAGPELAKIVAAVEWPAPNRAAALAALGSLRFDGLSETVERAADDPEPTVRAAAVRLAARLAPERALKLLDTALAGESLRERQAAIAVLAEMKTPAADQRLATWLDRLIAGQIPPGLRLDLIAAATLRGTPELAARLKQFAAAKPPDDPLADYRECLEGGDAERGRRIAVERVDLSCIRCHKVDEYGGLVGPDLSKIGRKQTREYLLEAIVLPNRSIAKGFESVLVTTDEGKVISGVLRSEDADSLQLVQADGVPVTIAKQSIEDRVAATSPMPDDLSKKLTKADLRDLVEFLSSLK
jgi:quinoprotein glucose dehydrogenase